MLEFKVNDYNEPQYDGCGNTCIAIIDINNIKIPLCRECLDDLIAGIETFKNTVFCEKCEHFIMSESGWRHGGSCQLKASKDGKVVESKDAGYNYCVGCLDTCKEAKLKE